MYQLFNLTFISAGSATYPYPCLDYNRLCLLVPYPRITQISQTHKSPQNLRHLLILDPLQRRLTLFAPSFESVSGDLSYSLYDMWDGVIDVEHGSNEKWSGAGRAGRMELRTV